MIPKKKIMSHIFLSSADKESNMAEVEKPTPKSSTYVVSLSPFQTRMPREPSKTSDEEEEEEEEEEEGKNAIGQKLAKLMESIARSWEKRLCSMSSTLELRLAWQ